MAVADNQQQRQLYVECIRKQLEEFDLLTSIYCSPGELHLIDAGVVSDFNEFINAAITSAEPDCMTSRALSGCLEYTIRVVVQTQNDNAKHEVDIRIELPHLYPALEHPIITIHSPLLSKTQELYFRQRIAAHVESLAEENSGEAAETYVYQIIAWIQEHIDDALKANAIATTSTKGTTIEADRLVHFERLWIYSHHIKSKTKRQEIVRQSHSLDLSGFSRPGKPGIICVEGLQEHTQAFWCIIKAMHWQKISICKAEVHSIKHKEINRLRRFTGFKEQLFCDVEDCSSKEGIMSMGQFIKYLEAHDCGYMKKELFGFD